MKWPPCRGDRGMGSYASGSHPHKNNHNAPRSVKNCRRVHADGIHIIYKLYIMFMRYIFYI